MAESDASTKHCCSCKTYIKLSDFYKSKSTKDGLQTKCKQCSKRHGEKFRSENPDYRKQYHIANKAHLLQQNAKWYAENRERESAKRRKYQRENVAYFILYRSEHREKCRVTAAEWRLRYPNQSRLMCRDYYARHRDRLAIGNKEWRKRNPEKVKTYGFNRRARKASGKLSIGIFGRLMMLQKGRCACCRGLLKILKPHIDHIMPLARGGQNVDSNVQLLCSTCNLSKHAKHPIDFMQSMGMLL